MHHRIYTKSEMIETIETVKRIPSMVFDVLDSLMDRPDGDLLRASVPRQLVRRRMSSRLNLRG